MKSLVPVPANPVPERPTLKASLYEFGPLPPEALFLGVASDGLPVLLNVHDPVPGPILVVSDEPTDMLKVIAAAASTMHDPRDIQFSVLSDDKDGWNREHTKSGHMVGKFAFYERGAEDMLLSMASWAHGNKNSRQSVLLLLDGIQKANTLDFDAIQNLRWLLLRGPARRVWPIVTVNADGYLGATSWAEVFRTRIFGRVADPEVAKFYGAKPEMVEDLPEGQFFMREGDHWLSFWQPTI